ncbi:MAG TPA: PEP-CTERM sorting domain-containing protein [Phycisphaerae bacterium]|nr:PEP-CTERM sorting domain-containing protein [Phycisphaerae bacterium]
MRGHKHFTRLLVTALFGLAATAAQVQAAITLHNVLEFSGGTPPSGSPPWLTATFDDGGGSGLVVMTLIATNLTGDEFVSGWYLNLSPTLSPASLIFSAPTKVGSFTTPGISKGVNQFKADGDGKYDILFSFATSGGASSRFTSGDSIRYTVTGIASLTENDFDVLSFPAGGHGPFTMAAHVQGIGPGGALSGWVATPEPMTSALLILGSLGFLRRRR